MSRSLVLNVATISEAAETGSLESLQEDGGDTSDSRGRSASPPPPPPPSPPLHLIPLSRSSSVVEHDAPSPPLHPLLIASLARSTHARSGEVSTGSSEASPPALRGARVVKPVTRPSSESIPRPTKLPLLRTGSLTSPSSSSPSSPSSPVYRPSQRPKLLHRHSFTAASLSSPTRIPVLSSPKKPGNVFEFPVVDGAVGRRMGKVRSQTLQLKEKFVTELSVYDPRPTPGDGVGEEGSGWPSRTLPLGVFLATDRCYGYHTLYKISPVTSLADLKLCAGDRLSRVNDFSVDCWSHACVVQFVRSCTLNCSGGGDQPYTTKLTLTLRRSSKQARAADSMATEDRVDASLSVELRTGLRVTSVQQSGERVYHSGSARYLLRLAGESHHVLHLLPPAGGGSARVVTGYPSADGGQTGCLVVHNYSVPPSMGGRGGRIVVLESPRGGLFLCAVSGSNPVLGVTANNVSPAAVGNVDSRFFRIEGQESGRVSLVHVMTGKYVSHGTDQLLLVDPSPESRARGDLEFQMFPCEH